MDVRGAPPDAEVVALVLAGDTEAFGIVIRRYEAGLLRFATRMLGSRDAAADAVAESFVRAYRHLASCREPARLRARSEEHTSELQSHGLISYAVFCLKKKKKKEMIGCDGGVREIVGD